MAVGTEKAKAAHLSSCVRNPTLALRVSRPQSRIEESIPNYTQRMLSTSYQDNTMLAQAQRSVKKFPLPFAGEGVPGIDRGDR